MLDFDFTVNHDEAQEFGRLPDGTYEVFITGAKETEASTGTKGIQMVMTVRDDVVQSGKGQKVWDTMWITPNTKGIIQGRLKAMQIPSGTQFHTMQDMIDAIKGLPVRIQVRAQANDDRYNEVVKYSPATVDGFYIAEESSEDTVVDISDDDMPF